MSCSSRIYHVEIFQEINPVLDKSLKEITQQTIMNTYWTLRRQALSCNYYGNKDGIGVNRFSDPSSNSGWDIFV